MQVDNRTKIRFTVVTLTSAFFAVLMTLIFQASADQNGLTDQVPRLLPYNGFLQFEGEPLTETGQWLKFELDDVSPEDGNATLVYSQSLQVDVYEGKFTAMLGPSDDDGIPLETVLASADDLHIQITVLGEHNPENPAATESDDIVLNNPQRLVMGSQAVWVTHASNFTVANTLNVSETHASTLATDRLTGPTGFSPNQFMTFNNENSNPIFIGDGNPDHQFGALFAVEGNWPHRPLFKLGKLTIDSEDGSGLINLVTGAYTSNGDSHKYIDSSGASRILMGDGALEFFTGLSNNQGQSMGTNVSWTRGLTIQPSETTAHHGLTVQEDGATLLTVASDGSTFSNGLTGDAFTATSQAQISTLTADSLESTTTNFGLTSGHTVIQNNFTSNGSSRFTTQNNTFNGSTTFQGPVVGPLALDTYVKQCNWTETCYCDNRSDMAITGGAWSGGDDEVIQDSHIIHSDAHGWGWQTLCIDAAGRQNNGEGNTKSCQATLIVCINVNAAQTIAPL